MLKYTSKTIPNELQKKYHTRIKNASYLGLFASMGAGKTKMIIDALGTKYFEDNEIDVAIIIAPKTCLYGWVDEIKVHLGECVPYSTFVYEAKNIKRKKDHYEFLDFAKSQNKLKFFIINPDAFQSSYSMEIIEILIQDSKYGVATIIDESTCIKNHTAVRTKKIMKLKKLSKVRYVLTGTPAPNTPTDFFSQCAFLSDRVLETPTINVFRSRYCVMKTMTLGNRQFQVEHSYINLRDLRDRLDKHCIFITPDEVDAALPGQNYLPPVYFEMSPEQKRIYKQMKDLFIASVDNSDDLITADSISAKLAKMQQITSGFVYATDKSSGERNTINIDKISENPRIEALLTTCADIQGKAIIFTRFTASAANVKEAMIKEYGAKQVELIEANLSSEEFEKRKDRFISDPNVRFLISNASTIARGVNKLTVANYIIYYENDYNLEVRLQSEKRIHRYGQDKPCFYIDIAAKGTIDELIAKALCEKKDLLTEIMDNKHLLLQLI